ncbi:MAG: circularly permuted type 2 ATP-grasp protein [Acidimicrobiales bacterium]|nr:circularly permuted type 2 ATP-grasp protein [Acidimicrobiales bacterium]
MKSDWTGYSSITFDELVDGDGKPRTGNEAVFQRLADLGPALVERQRAAEAEIRSMGITFTLYTEGSSIDRAWPIDVIPRIITASEWNTISGGLIQRLKALNMFIEDVYNEQNVVNDGILPAQWLEDSANFRTECCGVHPAGGVWAHISGSDLVRDATGQMMVLEDNLRVPSGVSYMLENRQISKRVFADLFRDLDIHPLDNYTEELGKMLSKLSPRDDVEPVIALLTPGIFNSAYYEHGMLATQIGAHLVEGSDLQVVDNIVYMKTVRGLVRVDVIYRRVDDLFLDPAVFRSDSTLGAAGLMAAWRAGNVALANAPGAGVADDKVLYSYVPDFIRYYLNEEPTLPNVPTWRCMEPDHRQHVLANLDSLVCKPANESGGKGVTIGNRATEEELDHLRTEIETDPRNWIAQPILSLSTSPTLCDGIIAPRHIDLRPFVLSSDEPFVSVGGLTRVALREGSLIVNSSQGGGSKDTWIVDESVRPDRLLEHRQPGQQQVQRSGNGQNPS